MKANLQYPSTQAGIAMVYMIMLTALVTIFLGTSVTYSIAANRAGRYELTKNIQAFPAGGQETHPPALGEQRGHQARRRAARGVSPS